MTTHFLRHLRTLGLSVAVVLATATASFAQDGPIIAVGDNLTVGLYMSPEETYPSVGGSLLDPPREVVVIATEGFTLTQAGARMGGIPLTATLEGDVIPAVGVATLLRQSVNPLVDPSDHPVSATGTLCGVAGTLTGAGIAKMTFLRTKPGNDVPCPPDSAFVFDDAAATQGEVHWIWAGAGRPDRGHTADEDVAAMVEWLGHDGYLVGSVIPSRGASAKRLGEIAATNEAFAATYGERYVDVLGALLAGGNDSAQDAADVAKGIVPRSLRADEIHLTAAGYRIVAEAFAAATERLNL